MAGRFRRRTSTASPARVRCSRTPLAPLPVCSPSRASIVTGLYPHGHGIIHNVDAARLPDGVRAAHAGRNQGCRCHHREASCIAAGYATHFYGKWHLLDEDLPYYPDMYTEHGAYARGNGGGRLRRSARTIATLDGLVRLGVAGAVEPRYRKAVTAAKSVWPEPAPTWISSAKMGRLKLPLEKNFDVRVADTAIERIGALGDQPFMITCSFNAPHDPNVVPSPYYEMFDPAQIELPANRTCANRGFEKSWSRQMVAGLASPGCGSSCGSTTPWCK